MADAAIFETGSLFWGDLLLVGCCVFYLLWWVLAFKPIGAVKGMRSAWLLIPAFLFGCAAVVLIFRGIGTANGVDSFFSTGTVLLAGVVSYIVLLAVTWFAFHRQVTTELFLIVGRAGYVDGMIPLLLAGAFMAVLAALIARAGR